MTKEETKLYMRRWYAAHRSQCNAYCRWWRKAHPDYIKQWRLKHPDYERRWETLNLDKTRISKRSWAKRNRDYFKQYRKRNVHKILAYRETKRALRNGELKRSEYCGRCGAKTNTQSHHPDYSKPLEILWLCVPCHLAAHGKMQRTQTR